MIGFDRVAVLRAARDHLAEVGLHKGALFADPLHVDRSACCPYGAIRWAMGDPVDSDVGQTEITRTTELLKNAAPSRYVARLADRAETTLDDVLGWFDAAIAGVAS